MLEIEADLGRIWKRRRRHLPPDVRRHLVQLMTCVGAYLTPDMTVPPSENIERARTDIREVVTLLRRLSMRETVDSAEGEDVPFRRARFLGCGVIWLTSLEMKLGTTFGSVMKGVLVR